MNTYDTAEAKRIDEIDLKLSKLRHTFEGFLPIYHQLDRKIKGIELEINTLQEERIKLTQGQFVLDMPF